MPEVEQTPEKQGRGVESIIAGSAAVVLGTIVLAKEVFFSPENTAASSLDSLLLRGTWGAVVVGGIYAVVRGAQRFMSSKTSNSG